MILSLPPLRCACAHAGGSRIAERGCSHRDPEAEDGHILRCIGGVTAGKEWKADRLVCSSAQHQHAWFFNALGFIYTLPISEHLSVSLSAWTDGLLLLSFPGPTVDAVASTEHRSKLIQ